MDVPQLYTDPTPLRIVFTPSQLAPFGLPIQIQNISELYYCLNDNEVVNDTIKTGNYIKLEKTL